MENTKQDLQDAIKQVQSQIDSYNAIEKVNDANPKQMQLDERNKWLSELNSQLSKLG